MRNKKLIGVVAGAGLCSGLLGGGMFVGLNHYYQNRVTILVPMPSNKAGGTKANDNKSSTPVAKSILGLDSDFYLE